MSKLKQAKSHIVKLFQLDISNENRINIFDVKALYDAAYEEKAQIRASIQKFNDILQQAQRLDTLYRAQIEADMASMYRKAV